MRSFVYSAVSGLLFGFGLAMSQMTNPQRILGFLTLRPGWDPTLAFVMAGALLVTIPGYFLLRAWHKPLYAESLAKPPRWPIEGRLLVGAACFGLGWGLSGYCPGPAIVASGSGNWGVLFILLPALIAGGWFSQQLESKQPD